MRSSALERLLSIVMSDSPQDEPEEIRRLLLCIAGPDIEPARAAALMDRFQVAIGKMELGFIMYGDMEDPHREAHRVECLAILRELGIRTH